MNKVIAVVAIIFVSASVKAQSTAQATASATIVSPISISKDADMNFGNVAVDGAIGGTVVMTPSGSRSATGGVTLPANAGTVSPAIFTVTGNAGFTYGVTLPVDITLLHSGGFDQMLADNLTSASANSYVLVGGTDELYVAGTLNVAPAQTPGVYTSGNFDVTVNYN